jgi:hypothetical protein
MHRPYVVIADPCADNRDSLALLLTICGFDADRVGSLAALRDRLQSGPAAGVVTEVFRSPEATARAIRDAAPRVPLAFYTTGSTDTARRQSAVLGARHLVKPLDVTRLVQWLSSLRDGRSCRRVLASAT